MKITIQKAKNGEETASADGHFLHSNYAPQKEAQRFADNLNLSYTPNQIIITEPALSYAADFLRQKYPQIKIGAIRYEKDFSPYNSKFDFVLNYYEHPDFEVYLENCFSEDELLLTYFISWTPSAQIFKEEENIVWKSIKAAMERAKTLLITRQYFEKKWLINSCNFFRNVQHVVSLDKMVDKDVLIISSGPSLKPFLNYIKDNQNKFFIICLSSAISVCVKNNIIPDLCITTDGGFWAGEHLKKLWKLDVPVAMPAEAFCSKGLLRKLKVLPLMYGEGISKDLTKASNIKYKSAVRNGTVSGTALLFAVQHSSKNIYMCGLDMANQTGFQHTQPNELELNTVIHDNRITNKDTRLSKSELTNGSLDIYRQWFCNFQLKDEKRKIYRLMKEEDRKNNLNQITDLSLDEFIKLVDENDSSESDIFTESDFKCDLKNLLNIFEKKDSVENIKKQLYPLDYVSLVHNNGSIEIQNKIDNAWNELKNKISGILNENI